MSDPRFRLSPVGRIIAADHGAFLRDLTAFAAVVLFVIGVAMLLTGWHG